VLKNFFGLFEALEAAFDSARRCAHWYDGCGLPHNCGVGELTFFWRLEEIKKLLVSLVVMRFVLSIPIPRITINRVGRIDLEHLFGVDEASKSWQQ
jgi:hypothetical protein